STALPLVLWPITVPSAGKRQLAWQLSGSVSLRDTLNSMYWAPPASSFPSMIATTTAPSQVFGPSRGAFVDEREPAFDAVEAPTNVVEPHLHAGKIHLHSGKIAFESSEPGDDLVELAVVLVLLAADRPQHIQDEIGALITHISSR